MRITIEINTRKMDLKDNCYYELFKILTLARGKQVKALYDALTSYRMGQDEL